jgi:hypothetical protein
MNPQLGLFSAVTGAGVGEGRPRKAGRRKRSVGGEGA